ncbi:MAG: ACP S-malonyltransferase [Clostridiaceae bacterium]|nr:ACP S-malonyltransferase [Clostridiaceae bacterium]
MTKLAFVFPGQGAQYIGMGKEIAMNYRKSDDIFNEASDALGFDIKKMIFEGDEETLKITENTQPAILVTSIACMQPLLDEGIRPDVAAGLSLGEYTAHVAVGTLQFKDAVSLVRKRGKYMQEAVPASYGAMAAIIGLENTTIEECCAEASKINVVAPANYNCPGQVVIAGEKKAVETAIELCVQKGAKRAVLLKVSAPFHCSLMEPAGKKLAAELEKVTLNDMSIPVVSNVNAGYVKDKLMVKDLLIRQVSSPVYWEASIRKMLEDGVDTFVEIGPGTVLSGFTRKIRKDAKVFNVENMASLEETLKEVREICS